MKTCFVVVKRKVTRGETEITAYAPQKVIKFPIIGMVFFNLHTHDGRQAIFTTRERAVLFADRKAQEWKDKQARKAKRTFKETVEYIANPHSF